MPNPNVIKPTIGRRLWYWPSESDKRSTCYLPSAEPQPFDAGVVFVHDDHTVNLLVTDHIGRIHSRTAVHLAQPGEDVPYDGYAAWMPYQIGQAKGRHTAAGPVRLS